LLKFTQFTSDWNETIIRQFYAIIEIDWDEESITWMTATFAEFAIACQINYETSKNGEYVWDSAPISVDTLSGFL
jgi:hypothetical protein